MGAHQALVDGRGLLAELYSLQLESCLHAECAGGDRSGVAGVAGRGGGSTAGAATLECADLLAAVDATPEAAADRCVYIVLLKTE